MMGLIKQQMMHAIFILSGMSLILWTCASHTTMHVSGAAHKAHAVSQQSTRQGVRIGGGISWRPAGLVQRKQHKVCMQDSKEHIAHVRISCMRDCLIWQAGAVTSKKPGLLP